MACSLEELFERVQKPARYTGGRVEQRNEKERGSGDPVCLLLSGYL